MPPSALSDIRGCRALQGCRPDAQTDARGSALPGYIRPHGRLSGYILVDKRVVGYFVAYVSPEIVCGPGQSRAGYDDTHNVKNDIAAAPLLQALIFQMDYRHVVYVGYFNKMLSLLQFADSALQFIVGVCHLRACRGKLQLGVKLRLSASSRSVSIASWFIYLLYIMR